MDRFDLMDWSGPFFLRVCAVPPPTPEEQGGSSTTLSQNPPLGPKPCQRFLALCAKLEIVHAKKKPKVIVILFPIRSKRFLFIFFSIALIQRRAERWSRGGGGGGCQCFLVGAQMRGSGCSVCWICCGCSGGGSCSGSSASTMLVQWCGGPAEGAAAGEPSPPGPPGPSTTSPPWKK